MKTRTLHEGDRVDMTAEHGERTDGTVVAVERNSVRVLWDSDQGLFWYKPEQLVGKDDPTA